MEYSKTTPKPESCDTFVALPPATANSSVVFGKNSDRPADEVQEVIYRPASGNEAGTKLQCTYIEIDQAVHTHAVILSKPSWMWGAEMGANEHGLCIGNEAVWTKLNGEEDYEEKLLGMDLVRLGLERGTTAREGVDVITSLLSQHGQGGNCQESSGKWAYHNSFLLADRTEAWVLETAGKYWAGERITEGVRNISNNLSITTKIDLMSPNLVEEAKKLGLYKDDGPFNFAKTFADSYQDPEVPSSDRFGHGKRLMKEYARGGSFDANNMMKILRNEDCGICMSGGFASTGSQVSVLPPAGQNQVCCHWFTATPNPKISVYKPFIFCPDPNIGNLVISPVPPKPGKKSDRKHELFKRNQALEKLLWEAERKGTSTLGSLNKLEERYFDEAEKLMADGSQSNSKIVQELFMNCCKEEAAIYP